MSKSKVKCIVTGETLGVRPEIYAKRVEKVGSESELLRTYIGRTGRNMLREGKTVDQIRKELGATDLPPVPQDVLDKLTASWKGKKYSNKRSNKKSVKINETEIQNSVPVDDDVRDFLAQGAPIPATT